MGHQMFAVSIHGPSNSKLQRLTTINAAPTQAVGVLRISECGVRIFVVWFFICTCFVW